MTTSGNPPRLPRWVQRVQAVATGHWLSHPSRPREDELTGWDASTLTDIGVTPEEFFAARAAPERAPDGTGFDS